MLTAKQYLVGLVYSQTQIYLGEIDLEFSEPTKLSHGDTRNTYIKVFPKVWVAIANGFDIYYNRVHVSRIRPFRIQCGSARTVYQVLDLINNSQQFNFTTDDLVDAALPVPDAQGYVVFKPQFKSTSLGFYDGDIVRTVVEYEDWTQTPPPDPIDPNDIPPAPYPSVPPNTLLRTECRDGDQWGYYSRFDNLPEWVLLSNNNIHCQSASFSPVTSRIPTVETIPVIITYFFNKLISTPINLRLVALDVLGNPTPTGIIQYKSGNTHTWSLVSTATGFSVPPNTEFFSIMVKTLPDTDDNIFIRIVEKGGDNNLSNSTSVDVQLDLTNTNVSNPPNYEPYGTLITQFCNGVSNWGRYHNGIGGEYEELITSNDPNCGYVQKPTMVVDNPVASIIEGGELVLSYTLSDVVTSPLGLKTTLNHFTTQPSDVDLFQYQLFGSTTWANIPFNGNIAIPQGDTQFKLRIVLKDDILVEGNEYIQIKVVETAGSPKLAASVVLCNVTIVDSEPPPLNPTATLVAETRDIVSSELSTMLVRFSLTESVNYNVPLVFKVTHRNTNDTDIVSYEYQSGGFGSFVPIISNDTIYNLAGSLYVDIRITTTADATTEGVERFTISLEEPVANTYLSNTGPVTKLIIIMDDSQTP